MIDTSTPQQDTDPRSGEDTALLNLVGVSKRYPGVAALSNVNFDLRGGEVHVVFGENGAGKSTLISILSGAAQPTEGSIEFRQQPVRLSTVNEARRLGISAVFQEFSLVPTLSVADNLLLGSEPTTRRLVDRKASRREASALLDDLQFSITPDQIVSRLTRAEQQMVEIAKAFRSEIQVLILDEPTASLTDTEAERLFELVEAARAKGIGIVYITHRLAEIERLADRVTVLRDGKNVETIDRSEVTEKRLLELMTGRVIDEVFPNIDFVPGKVMLRADNISSTDRTIRDASFEVRAGEIVGLAGLVGSGKSGAGRAAFGLSSVQSGTLDVGGEDVTGQGPDRLLRRGVSYVPADRKSDGLMMMRGVRENIALSSVSLGRYSNGPIVRRAAEREAADDLARRVELHPHAMERPVEHFSGGNQQKVLLARSLAQESDVLIFDEPTVGVDVGTRVAIYRLLAELCENGAAILLISSDISEILNLTNRVYVFHRSRVVDHLSGDEITEANVLRNFLDRIPA